VCAAADRGQTGVAGSRWRSWVSARGISIEQHHRWWHAAKHKKQIRERPLGL
jgi:hypothetical protein